MPNLLRSWLLLALLSLPTLTATFSCTKKADDPGPTTGGLAGTVSPADALTGVTATDGGGLTFVARPAAGTGAFALADLKPGTYALSFAPASGYAAPAPRNITVVAGQTAAAGTVVVPGDGTPRGTLTWTVNGTTYTATAFSGTISNQTLDLTATATAGTTRDQLSLNVPGFQGGSGTYQLGFFGPGVPGASYSRTVGGIPTLEYSTYNTGSTGTVAVTAFDANARTLSGTFGFVGQGYNATVGSMAVSNGTFNLRY